MHDVRALRLRAAGLLALAIAGGALAPAAHAELRSIYTGTAYQSVSGAASDPTSSSALPADSRVSRFEQTVRYVDEGVGGPWTFSGSLTHAQPDYSSYWITQKGGDAVALSALDPVRDEFVGALSASWDSGPHSVRLDWAGNVSASPFLTETLTASWSEAFVEKTTVLGVKAQRFVTEQPLSYFIDGNFQTRARPTVVHGWGVSALWDQAVSERYKFGWELSGGAREEDRPRNLGLTLRQAYALADRAFAQLELSRLQELRSDPLLDERGYFALSAAELSFTFEPWVDLLITPSYSYVVENEDGRADGSSLQVGSDQYGLGFRYRRGRWGVEAKGAYRVTNTQLHDLSAGGGVTWQI
jgi:hypothetical protein